MAIEKIKILGTALELLDKAALLIQSIYLENGPKVWIGIVV